MDRRRILGRAMQSALAVGFGSLRGVGCASAEETWPAHTISMIVPFPPGGQADFAARPVAEALRKSLGVAVSVDNRGGAGGSIGNTFVARANPDGYKVLMTLSSFAVLPEAQKLFGLEPNYTVDQLAPVARVLADPAVLCVHKSTPYQTAQDFIADAKARPDAIAYASSGNYGTTHLAMEMLCHAASLKLVHVPYRGVGPAMNDVVSGQIKVAAAAPASAKPQSDAGNIRVLGIFGAERIASYPGIPTFIELGFAGVECYIWAGLFAPSQTPNPIMTRLRGAMREAMIDPVVTDAFATVGSPPAYLDAPEFAAFIASDGVRLINAVHAIGKLGTKLE
jgi:tripartite-type tricarboxylate transporter receptor subunit TctC